MKIYELVAASVLRAGLYMSPFTWAELGTVFGVTKDAVRHQLNRFKENYNVVDADIDTKWSRTFLKVYTPESEKNELDGLTLLPGDTKDGYVIFNNSADGVQILYNDGRKILYRGFGLTETPDEQPEPIKFEEKMVSAPNPVVQEIQSIITPNVVIVVRDGQPLTIDKSHKNFSKISEALNNKQYQLVFDLIDMKNALTKYSNGRVTVEGGAVTLDGEKVHGKVMDRLVDALLNENLESLEAISNFLVKCDENPDYRVVTRIFDFMSHNDLRLDKDGDIMAYKVVRGDYKDKYTNTMDNSPGQVVSMKRNKVNPKDEETCSHGLHVAAKKYIPSYGSPSLMQGGDKVVLCKVNPKNFVSIPTDYNSMKARVCEYLVVKDVTELFVNRQDMEEDQVSVNA